MPRNTTQREHIVSCVTDWQVNTAAGRMPIVHHLLALIHELRPHGGQADVRDGKSDGGNIALHKATIKQTNMGTRP